MPSPRTTDDRPPGRPGTWKGGALRRAHPLDGRSTSVRRLAILLATLTLASAVAGPGPFSGTVHRPCPDAVLPMRLATFQGLPEGSAAVAEWILHDEFKESVPWVSVRPGSERITVVVFAYVGSMAETMAFEIATPDGILTWRSEIPIETPDAGVLTMSFYPSYSAIDVPQAAWNTIFPTPGPYLLRARRPDVASTYVDAFCGAETSSWLLVVR